MKYFIVFLVLLAAALALPHPQIEHGSFNGPSGRFERTRDLATPPVDLSQLPIFLPEATPIQEAKQEQALQSSSAQATK